MSDLHKQFVHFHHQSALIGTACFLMEKRPDGSEQCVGHGFAFPSKRDVATKARGRAIAAGRAIKDSNSIRSVFSKVDLKTILDSLEYIVADNSKRGVNLDQLRQKMENTRRWFFPNPA